MKNKYHLINLMYRKMQGLFWGGLVVLTLLTLANHIDVISILLHKDAKIKYTVRGDVGLIQKDWKTMPKSEVSLLDAHTDVRPIVLIKKFAFVRLDYDYVSKGLSVKNIAITLLSIASWWIWLLLIYQMMKILGSFRNNMVFHSYNIRRIKIIGLVFFMFPLLVRAKDILFTQVVSETVQLDGVLIGQEHGFWVFPAIISLNVLLGFMAMLFILILSQIFAYGMILKSENDLTV